MFYIVDILPFAVIHVATIFLPICDFSLDFSFSDFAIQSFYFKLFILFNLSLFPLILSGICLIAESLSLYTGYR